MIFPGEIPLYYEVSGSGRPLVLLHGNGEDRRVFDDLIPRLAEHFQVYALDSRCHGKSGTGELSYAAMAGDVATFIRGLGLAKPGLLGFSDGAIVGLLLAIGHPDLLGALVSCGANTRPEEVRWWFRACVWAVHAVTRDPKLRLMLKEPDISPEQLSRIRVPTLVAAGSRDLMAQRYTRALAAAIPGSELAILPGRTHTGYIRRSAGLAALALPFLQAALPAGNA